MGPAGFTLAHHLLNDGHTVVGVDGLKIEPLDATLSGVTARGERVPFAPIRDLATLAEPLDDRVMAGFGGVAEYGITVRWDKNFLKLIRLLLERRARFGMYGGVRFGGTLDAEDAFALGFDHVALAAGAGKPTVLELPNGLASGVRTASDFLMALQAHGCGEARLGGEHAVASAGGGGRRRTQPPSTRRPNRSRTTPSRWRNFLLATRRWWPSRGTRRSSPCGPRTSGSWAPNFWNTHGRYAPNALRQRPSTVSRALPSCWTRGAARPSRIAAG